MDERRMQCFLWTATYGNLHRVAEQLSMTQPSVSYQLKALERELGFSPFRREGKALKLTEAGTELYGDLLRIHSEYRRSIERARKIALGRDGALAISWPATICDRDLIAAAVRAYRDAGETREVDVVATDRVADIMLAGGRPVDVAVTLVEDRDADDDLEYVSLCAMSTACEVGVSHPLSSSATLALEDLTTQTVLMVPPGRYLRLYNRLVERLLSGKPPINVRFVESQSDIEVNVASGAGVTLRPVPLERLNVPRPDRGVIAIPTDPSTPSHLAFAFDPTNEGARTFCKHAERGVREMLQRGE